MKIAYLINAHKNFRQLQRLVARLDNGNADFFIHVDKKVKAPVFSSLVESLNKSNVSVVPERVDVKWGGFSQVEATLSGLRSILRSSNHYDYISFISGQDYPIRGNSHILGFLAANQGCEFIDYCRLAPDGWAEAMIRFEKYWLLEKISYYRIHSCIQYVLDRLLPKRRVPNGYDAFCGSQWWTISSGCAGYIVDFCNENNEFVDFFRYTLCPDEMFFQTILVNSKYKEKIFNDNLRYIDWTEKNTSPKILTKDDYYRIISSNKLYARKFDAGIDEDVMDLIDNHIDNHCNEVATEPG